MTSVLDKLKDTAIRFVGRAVSGPRFAVNAVKTATLSVAQVLAELWGLGIADDIRLLKEDGLKRSAASARKLMAEAVEAENKATLAKRNDRISKAEEQQKLADAAKTNAEAKAALIKAKAERIRAVADAHVGLIEAISKLKQKGGSVAIDPENLARLMGLDDPDKLLLSDSDEPRSEEPEAKNEEDEAAQ